MSLNLNLRLNVNLNLNLNVSLDLDLDLDPNVNVNLNLDPSLNLNPATLYQGSLRCLSLRSEVHRQNVVVHTARVFRFCCVKKFVKSSVDSTQTPRVGLKAQDHKHGEKYTGFHVFRFTP